MGRKKIYTAEEAEERRKAAERKASRKYRKNKAATSEPEPWETDSAQIEASDPRGILKGPFGDGSKPLAAAGAPPPPAEPPAPARKKRTRKPKATLVSQGTGEVVMQEALRAALAQPEPWEQVGAPVEKEPWE